MRDFKRLKVWDKAHRLSLLVYKTTQSFPKEELYGLTSQLRRCSASIPSNIAEGCGRDGAIELRRYLRMALGSASELEYQCLLARDLSLISTSEHQRLDERATEVKRMLAGLILKLT